MTRLARPAALLVLLLAGCPSGGPGVQLEQPANLTVQAGADRDEAAVSWDAVAGATAYDLQYRLDGGAWGDLAVTVPAGPAGVRMGGSLRILNAPELFTVEVRVRARHGASASTYSEPAGWTRPPLPPAALEAAIEAEERVRLSWVQGSAAADGIHVARASYDDATFTWGQFAEVAALPAGATGWLDADPALPGKAVQYTVWNSATHGGVALRSAELLAFPPRRPAVLPPDGLAVTLQAGAPRLTWTNRSGAATALRVERRPVLLDGLEPGYPSLAFLPVADLPAVATSWTDAVPEGPYTYRVVALAGQLPGPSAPASVVVPPAGLDARVVMAPSAVALARDAADALWAASEGTGVHLWEPGSSGWVDHAFDPAGWVVAVQGIAFDPTGRPHLLYLQDVPTGITPGPADLVHAWREGLVWRHEVIARRTFDYDGNYRPRAYLAFDEAGAPHVAWQDWVGGFPEHAALGSGGWTIETVTSTRYDQHLAFDLVGFAGAPDGTLSLLVAAPGALVLASRPPGGAWSDEVLPTTGTVGLLGGGALAVRTGGVTVVYVRFDQAAERTQRLTAITKESGAWGAPVELATYGTGGASGQPWQLATAGGRTALLLPQGDPEGLWLYRTDGAGAWQGTRLSHSTEWEACGLGFLADGRIWALAPATPSQVSQQPAGTPRAYVSFEEPERPEATPRARP